MLIPAFVAVPLRLVFLVVIVVLAAVFMVVAAGLETVRIMFDE